MLTSLFQVSYRSPASVSSPYPVHLSRPAWQLSIKLHQHSPLTSHPCFVAAVADSGSAVAVVAPADPYSVLFRLVSDPASGLSADPDSAAVAVGLSTVSVRHQIITCFVTLRIIAQRLLVSLYTLRKLL